MPPAPSGDTTSYGPRRTPGARGIRAIVLHRRLRLAAVDELLLDRLRLVDLAEEGLDIVFHFRAGARVEILERLDERQDLLVLVAESLRHLVEFLHRPAGAAIHSIDDASETET